LKKAFEVTHLLVYVVFVLVALAVILKILCMLDPDLASPTIAAWVQAVGSIGAIGSAVWVLNRQHDAAIARDEDEIRQVLYSLRDEIAVISEGFAINTGETLRNSQRGTPFKFTTPLAERPFMVYEKCTDKLGKIKDHDLRKCIVTTYAKAFGLVQSIRFNNFMVAQWLEAEVQAAQTKLPVFIEQAKIRHERITVYGDKLRDAYEDVTQSVNELWIRMPIE
jgi:hypothetical protein